MPESANFSVDDSAHFVTTSTAACNTAARGADVAISDETLVRGVLNGDREAFAELYDRRARLIRGLCLAMTRDADAAADLCQEVFLRAYQRLGSLREPARFIAWLAGIAKQVCREWLRSRARDRRCAVATAGSGEVGPAATERERDDNPVRNEQHARLHAALADLPSNERLALLAFYLQGMDADEARRVVGLSRSGLYRLLASARRRLGRKLQREEVMP